MSQHCVVVVDLLRTFKQPTEQSSSVSTFRRGTHLSFNTQVLGQMLQQDNRWGHHVGTGTEDFYFWLGGVRMLQAASTQGEA